MAWGLLVILAMNAVNNNIRSNNMNNEAKKAILKACSQLACDAHRKLKRKRIKNATIHNQMHELCETGRGIQAMIAELNN